MLINLGQVAGIIISTTAPTNPKILWYDDNVGQKIHKYFNNATGQWEPLIFGSSSAVIQQELTVAGVTVGNVSTGKNWPAQTPIETILRDILIRAVAPTYVAPTGNLVISPTTTFYEVGTQISLTHTPTFNQNDGGSLNNYSLRKNTVEISTNFAPFNEPPYIVQEQAYNYQAVFSFDQGPVKNNNLGQPDSTGRIQAGSVNSPTRTVNGILPYFYGVKSTDNVTGADVYSGTKVIQPTPTTIVLNSGFGSGINYLWFAVPVSSGRNYSSWWRSALNSGSIGGASNLFKDRVTISVTSVGKDSNWTENYYLWVSNYQTDAGLYTEIRP